MHTLNYVDISPERIARPPVLTKALHTAPECEVWRRSIKWLGGDDPRRTFAKRYIYRLHYRGAPEYAGDIPGARLLGFNQARLVAASQAYLVLHPAIVEFWTKTDRQALRSKDPVVYTFRGRPRRLTNPNEKARLREASNQPMQGGVADIYILTALQVKKACPWARMVFGSHDSHYWDVPVEREAEFNETYRPIVTQTWQITKNVTMDFPASWKRRIAE